jgi:hypothetical protein
MKEMAPAAIPALERLATAQKERGIDDTYLDDSSIQVEIKRQHNLLLENQSHWQTFVLRYLWYDRG